MGLSMIVLSTCDRCGRSEQSPYTRAGYPRQSAATVMEEAADQLRRAGWGDLSMHSTVRAARWLCRPCMDEAAILLTGDGKTE